MSTPTITEVRIKGTTFISQQEIFRDKRIVGLVSQFHLTKVFGGLRPVWFREALAVNFELGISSWCVSGLWLLGAILTPTAEVKMEGRAVLAGIHFGPCDITAPVSQWGHL